MESQAGGFEKRAASETERPVLFLI